MLNTIHEERINKGKWNESLCFVSDRYPRTEITVQKSFIAPNNKKVEQWHIYYTSTRTSHIMRLSITAQSEAEDLGRNFAHAVFNSSTPYQTAREL